MQKEPAWAGRGLRGGGQLAGAGEEQKKGEGVWTGAAEDGGLQPRTWLLPAPAEDARRRRADDAVRGWWWGGGRRPGRWGEAGGGQAAGEAPGCSPGAAGRGSGCGLRRGPHGRRRRRVQAGRRGREGRLCKEKADGASPAAGDAGRGGAELSPPRGRLRPPSPACPPAPASGKAARRGRRTGLAGAPKSSSLALGPGGGFVRNDGVQIQLFGVFALRTLLGGGVLRQWKDEML